MPFAGLEHHLFDEAASQDRGIVAASSYGDVGHLLHPFHISIDDAFTLKYPYRRRQDRYAEARGDESYRNVELAYLLNDIGKDPSGGYNELLEYRMERILPLWAKNHFKVITNMGAANPFAGFEFRDEPRIGRRSNQFSRPRRAREKRDRPPAKLGGTVWIERGGKEKRIPRMRYVPTPSRSVVFFLFTLQTFRRIMASYALLFMLPLKEAIDYERF